MTASDSCAAPPLRPRDALGRLVGRLPGARGGQPALYDYSGEGRFNIRSMAFVYLIYVILVGTTEIVGVGLLGN